MWLGAEHAAQGGERSTAAAAYPYLMTEGQQFLDIVLYILNIL